MPTAPVRDVQLDALDLAAMPPLPDPVLAAHDTAQAELAAALGTADAHVLRLFRHVQMRVLAEAAASFDAPWVDRDPVVMPPRRRYLNRLQQYRLTGVTNAITHIDTRVAMHRIGAVPTVVEYDTPLVVHAFAEAGDPDRRVTNAGCIRATPVRFVDGDIPFIPPAAEHCRRLVANAIELANAAPAPALTRATWLMSALFAIHPFVDGNGRTGRLMMLAIQSEQLAIGIDWGTIPEIAARRGAYLDAARAPLWPSVPDYDARKMEPIHLMLHTATAAVAGARRTRERLAVLAGRFAAARAAGLSADAALVLNAVAADRNAPLAELTGVVAEPDLTEVVLGLVRDRLLAWSRWGDLDPTAAGWNALATG